MQYLGYPYMNLLQIAKKINAIYKLLLVPGQFSYTLRFGAPKADFLKLLHRYPFPSFYQEVLNLGDQKLLLRYPANFMTCATILAILLPKNNF